MVLFGFGLAFYQIQDRISFYLMRPTAANMDIQNNAVIDFPQVTVCNENTVLSNVAQRLGK
jgi:hypothetical protein